MTDKQKVLTKYPQATLFKSENGLYMILSHVPMGTRIERRTNKTPAEAWKSAAFSVFLKELKTCLHRKELKR